MSFLDGLMGGGGGKWQVKQQIADNEKRRAFIEQQIAQGRGDLAATYGAGMNYLNNGMQQGFDVLGQTIPQQFDTFQQGNVGAQATLLAGLPQYQNAIMGLPVDMSGFSPQAIDYNTDWAQQYAPGYSPLSGSMPGGGQGFNQPGGSVDAAPGALDPNFNSANGMDSATNDGSGNFHSGGQWGGSNSSGHFNNQSGWQTGGNNPFSDTYNASELEKAFGHQDIGSLAGLTTAENSRLIGRGVGLLSGLPLMGQLGGWLGNQYMNSHTFMSPVDPNNPYGQQGVEILDKNGLPLIAETNPNQSFGFNPGRTGSIRSPFGSNSGWQAQGGGYGATGNYGGGTLGSGNSTKIPTKWLSH